MPTVVVAYSEFPDTEVEANVLQAVGATLLHTRGLETAEQLAAARQADALMVSTQAVPASLLAELARCRIISRVGTGLDAIDIPAATARGIWVTNVPDYSVDEVSTHAITLLLAQARRLPRMLAATRRGEWDSRLARPFLRLAGQRLGLLGFGRIAQAVAAKARGLGLEVAAHDPFVPAEVMPAAGVRAVAIAALWRESDFISLHTPLTEATRRIVNAAALAQMKPTAYLINTARGALVDEDALLQAVRSGQIAGAALDVLLVEPPAPDHPLLLDDRLLVTPHYGWYSEAATVDVRVRGAEEVVRVLRGERPRCPANDLAEFRKEA
jgi:D-3-phosphoglycerate dehydrogenase / 2-oxoglutarate reductase